MYFDVIAFFSGLGTGLGLIIGIGAQNAFVLKQSILQNHQYIIAAICMIIDAILIAAGVGGLGVVLTSNKLLLEFSRFGGALFLGYYGFKSFRNSMHNESMRLDLDSKKISLRQAVITTLALSLLNPHVYLDTCLFIGSIGAQFQEHERGSFAAGAMLSSVVWFAGLSHFSKYLIPLFQKTVFWKILDVLIGAVMWFLAGYLVFGL